MHPMHPMQPLCSLIPVLAVALSAACPARAQDEPFSFPDTVVGGRAAALVAAHNDGSDQALASFYEEHAGAAMRERLTAESMVSRMQEIGKTVGDIEPHSVTRSTPHEISMLVRLAGAGMWARLELACEDGAPHRLATFTIQPAAAPEVEEASYDTWTDLADLLRQARADGDLPALAAAVVEGGQVVAEAAVGVRLRGAEETVQVGDLFHIGSVTKSVTATMIARLVERGDLTWTTTIGEALPHIEMLDAYRDVTLERVVRHRAGIPQYQTLDDDEMARFLGLPGDATAQRAGFVEQVLSDEPIASDRMQYSNAGYAVAGHMAETVTGRPWETLLREEVFEPLGMKSAGIGWPATPERHDQPRGHAPTGPQELDDEYRLGAFMGPAGDVHCTMGDLARYARLHLGGLRGRDGALQAATIAKLHAPPDDDGDGPKYAAGWVLTETPDGKPVHWHNGSAGTFYALVALLPESDRAVVIATNAGDLGAEALAWKIIEAIRARGGLAGPK